MSIKRQIAANQVYHVYNRAILKMTLFREPADYLRFMIKMSQCKKHYPVQILAFCIMPNHYHLLMKEAKIVAMENRPNISGFMQQLQTSYAKYFGMKYKHSGRVFQGVYKSKHVKTDEQLWQTTEYIHNNPLRKKYVKKAAQWPYSSLSNPDL